MYKVDCQKDTKNWYLQLIRCLKMDPSNNFISTPLPIHNAFLIQVYCISVAKFDADFKIFLKCAFAFFVCFERRMS